MFDRVETVQDVAKTLPKDDERRAKLLAGSDAALAEEGTVRPVIAATLLGLSEKTVRAWAKEACWPSPSGRRGCCWMCEAFMRSAISSGTCGRSAGTGICWMRCGAV